jgi:hypothetical protein
MIESCEGTWNIFWVIQFAHPSREFVAAYLPVISIEMPKPSSQCRTFLLDEEILDRLGLTLHIRIY